MSQCVVITVTPRVFVCRDMLDDNITVKYAVRVKLRARVEWGRVLVRCVLQTLDIVNCERARCCSFAALKTVGFLLLVFQMARIRQW